MASDILRAITVVDMTEGVAGPYTSMVLADMGANVVKVERPEGDWSRGSGRGGIPGGDSATFVALNRNKRNLGLDIAAPGGHEVIARLIGHADVVVSNYRAGVMARLGLDYDRCKAIRADLVYCTISGFGLEGPYARLPASDTIMQAMSGVMSVTGEADGPPLRVGFPLIDLAAAHNAIQAILLALYGRRDGRGGANIEISLMAAAVGLMIAPMTDHLATGRVPERQGHQNTNLAPAGAYMTAGGRWITIAVLREEHWAKLCKALDLEHLRDDPRFSSNARRMANRDALDAILAPLLRAEPADRLLARLRAADILCGPINTLADVAADPALATGLPLVDPMIAGLPRVMGVPIRLDGQWLATERPPPARGQHTRDVLAELGFTAADIARLQRDGAVSMAS